MIPGLGGHLLSASFAQERLPTLAGAMVPPPTVQRAFERWSERRQEAFGPASGVRTVADGLIVPLLRVLGFTDIRRTDGPDLVRLDVWRHAAAPVPILVVGWSDDLDQARRPTIFAAIAADTRWCMCASGLALRIVDAHRTWSREHLEIDFELLGESLDLQTVLWSVARADAFNTDPVVLDVAAAGSAEHGAAVCRALGAGVLESMRILLTALTARERPGEGTDRLFGQALTIVYRVLFLLFAEARGLVPVWHPVYRDRYTIGTIVSALLAEGHHRGVWAAIQAISRLAYAGCTAGELTVTAFNGRLFSPAQAPAFERRRFDDRAVADAVLAISTTSGRAGRTRIRYRDLDVEQLGAVYERVLEYRPGRVGDEPLTRDRDRRQASGTFYTPRTVTAFLVRQTLAPLVTGRSAEEILALRVLDPAMGSGAFLVSACRFLATAVEEARLRDGEWHPGEVTAAERSSLRREIAQRCLFGVDINPVAVQLARLSLWLTTLAANKPLTFLDHHLVTGNSLVGAAPEDVARQPGGTRGRQGRPLPLFDQDELDAMVQVAARAREALARQADDSAEIVRDKERRLLAVHDANAPLGRWNRLLDLWCAGWFVAGPGRIDRGLFADLVERVLHGRGSLPEATARPILAQVEQTATRLRFLHWPLAFPEVLQWRENGNPSPGFDAVIGNPPWDMIRGDSGEDATREARRDDARQLVGFVRESGVYRMESHAHLNRCVLFLERALQLTRADGRIGLVLPAGIVSDVGNAPVRRYAFDHARVDTLTGLDNRAGIFPIHRSMRFVLMTASPGRATTEIACRFGVSRPETLDSPQQPDATHGPLVLSRAFLARASGADDLGVPELLSAVDLRILEQVTATVPCVGDPEGWNLRFGRELNVTDDRALFVPATGRDPGRPVLEGKQIEPFQVRLDRVRYALRADAETRIPRRARLAYRDVAGAGNRLTLIAAIVPARAVTTHTLFCLKSPLPLDAQQVACGLFNSFVANYLIRLRVSTHVTTGLVARLRLPVVERGTSVFARLASLSQTLSYITGTVESCPEYAEIQALAARLYGFSEADFAHVLSTFPLVPEGVRGAALARFRGLAEGWHPG